MIHQSYIITICTLNPFLTYLRCFVTMNVSLRYVYYYYI